jgi:drug/metabolite transporter (DMT)-like permease
MTNEKKSILLTLSAVFFWSTVATAFKLTLKGLSFVHLLFWASLTSTLILFIIAVNEKQNLSEALFAKNQLAHNILLGFINPFLYYMVLFKAYELLPAQEAQPLNYTWPIMISIFAVLFLKEKVSLKIILGLIVSFAGVIVLATHGNIFALHFDNLFGTSLALGSSVIWATFWTLKLKDRRPASVKLLSAFFYGTIITLIYILIFDKFSIPKTKYLLGAVYVGLFEMGITFFLWMKGISLSSNQSKTSTLAYLSPFVSLLFIAFILGEKILLSSIIGLVLIISGILVQHLTRTKQ